MVGGVGGDGVWKGFDFATCRVCSSNGPSASKPIAPPTPHTQPQAEEALSKLVVSKAVSVKIDRPAGVVTVGKKKAPEDVLNAWASNIGKLLGLVDKASQQIDKEFMTNKVVRSTA